MDKSIVPILNWVETREEPISMAQLKDLSNSMMLDYEVEQLAAAMFGFMNDILCGEAHTVLRTLSEPNGLKVCCIVTRNITNRSATRRNTLLKTI